MAQSKKMSLVIPDWLAQKVEDYQFENRLPSTSDAVRKLIEIGIASVDNGVDRAFPEEGYSEYDVKFLQGVTEQLSPDSLEVLKYVVSCLMIADTTLAAVKSMGLDKDFPSDEKDAEKYIDLLELFNRGNQEEGGPE